MFMSSSIWPPDADFRYIVDCSILLFEITVAPSFASIKKILLLCVNFTTVFCPFNFFTSCILTTNDPVLFITTTLSMLSPVIFIGNLELINKPIINLPRVPEF